VSLLPQLIEQQVRLRARVLVLSAIAFSACVMKRRQTMIEQQVLWRARVFVLSATAFSACVMKRRLTMFEQQVCRCDVVRACLCCLPQRSQRV